MNIKDTYNVLLTKDLTIINFDEVTELRNQCKLENNYEYYYLSTLLQIDIYINENLLDDALNITLRNFNDLDKSLYSNIYVSVLERLIYIFITKRNFQSAFKYANEKQNYINNNDVETVNRWYLEMAYIYEALQEKSKSLTNLLAILNNNPDDSLKVIILGNITKLYIDAKDIENATNYLEKCMNLTEKLNDEASLRYCDYLNAKILMLEKKNKFAIKIFVDLFKNNKTFDDENIGYLNEFISLLIEEEQYSEAKKYIDSYQKYVLESKDQYLKKDFYKNNLKVAMMLLPGSKEEIRKLLDYIELIENDISKNDEKNIIEASEDSKTFELNEKLHETLEQIEKTINLVNFAMVKTGERESILEFSKSLEKIVPFNEALYVIFNRANFELLTNLYDSFSSVSTFNYKKQRLYERELKYNDLNGTIIEMLISGAKDINIDFSDTNIHIKDPISGLAYTDLKVKWLFATSLNYDGDLYGCVVFTSSIYDISDPMAIINLKIASQLLESKLINLFYQENLQTQNEILEVAMSGLQEGIFYFEKKNQRMAITEPLSRFLQIPDTKISRNDYAKLVVEEDKEKIDRINDFIEQGVNYKVAYTLKINGSFINVIEQGKPYISRDKIVKFYVCTINKVDVLEKEVKIYTKNMLDVFDYFEKKKSIKNQVQNSEFKFTEILVKVNNLDSFSSTIKANICLQKYKVLNEISEQNVFFINENTFSIITYTIDQRNLEKIFRLISNIFNEKSNIEECEIILDYSISMIRYPKDISIVDDLFEYNEYCVDTKYINNQFDNEDYIKFVNNKQMNNIVSDKINSNSVQILYSIIKMDEITVGYYVRYNIPGILMNVNVKNILSENNIINFELYMLNKILGEEKSLHVKFIELNDITIKNLIENDYLKKFSAEELKSIIVCINGSKNIINNIEYLSKNMVKIFLKENTFKEIPFDISIYTKISGIQMINEEKSQEFYDIMRVFKYQLLEDERNSTYRNSIYFTDEIIDFKNM